MKAASFAVAGMLLLSFRPVSAQQPKRIVALISGSMPIYNDAVEGFSGELKSKGVPFTLDRLVLPQEEGKMEAVIRDVRSNRPDLILTVGTSAARAARDRLSDLPFVFSMIVDPEVLSMRTTGAVMEVYPPDQVAFIRKQFPRFRRVGVVGGSDRNKQTMRLFREMSFPDLKISIYTADSPEEFAAALQRLVGEVDCLLMVADSALYSAQTAAQVILQTIQNDIGLIAISFPFVKAGALAAVYPEYRNNGALAARAAARYFAGESLQDIPVQWPSETVTAVNLIVAQRLGITMDPRQVESFDEVVR